jgi:CheY-like chemotaxis protein
MAFKRNEPLNILMVEDNLGDILLLNEAFKEGQVTAKMSVVSDGEEALIYLRRGGKYAGMPVPDLILLDLNLPRMDGRTFLRRVKEDPMFRSLPVIVLSSSNLESDVREAYDMSASCYLVKPSDLEGFQKISKFLREFWEGLVRFPARPRDVV